MAEGSAGAPPAPSCRRGVGPASPGSRRCCWCGLGRLVRRLRRPATSTTLRGCQYDPLSYARNFDGSGFGTALEDSDPDAAQLYYNYTFSSRFVLAPSAAGTAAAAAPTGLTSH